MPNNELSAHLYKDGHVTHTWEQSRFLKEAFDNEDALRAEVEHFGTVRPKRSDLLDWPSSRSSMRSSRSSARMSRSSRSCGSKCSCNCSARLGTGRSQLSCESGFYSAASSYCTCDCHSARSSLLSESFRSVDSVRSDSTVALERLQRRKHMLENRLEELEVELNGFTSRSGTARGVGRSARAATGRLILRSARSAAGSVASAPLAK